METVNINITQELILPPPSTLLENIKVTDKDCKFISESRAAIINILNGNDTRLLCIVGPCSIHNVDEALNYARRLKNIMKELPNIFLVMRVYCEKPRTVTGWKGLMYDPNLDNTNDIVTGLYTTRQLLLSINRIGVPCACELLDTILPQYYSDLVSWGCIGARTCESQLHRQLVSGLSMPVGFKNSTSGSIDVAIDSILSSRCKHIFPGLSFSGTPAILKTNGNQSTHVILRGGKDGPNYDIETLKITDAKLQGRSISNRSIIIDCSHGNSEKDYKKQENVVMDLLYQKPRLFRGIMIESNIKSGKQKLDYQNPSLLDMGVSITDGCLGFEETFELLKRVSELNEH